MAPSHYYTTASTDSITTCWNNWADTTTASSTGATWSYWQDTSTPTATCDTKIWRDWMGQLRYKVRYDPYPVIPDPYPVTPPRAPAANAHVLERTAHEKAMAEARAEILLKQHLTPEQLRDYEKHKRFRVNVGNRQYEIDCTKRMHNVHEVERGKLTLEHCIYAKGNVPLCDNALAQLLMLETDEDAFRRIANQTRISGNLRSRLAA